MVMSVGEHKSLGNEVAKNIFFHSEATAHPRSGIFTNPFAHKQKSGNQMGPSNKCLVYKYYSSFTKLTSFLGKENTQNESL